MLIFSGDKKYDEAFRAVYFLRIREKLEVKSRTTSCPRPGILRSSIIKLNYSKTATLGTEESGRCGAVAVLERLKQESMYGLSAKKVAFVERFKQESMYGLSAKKVTFVERLKQESVYGLSAKKVTFVERLKQETMYGLSAKKMVFVERLKQESMYGLSAKKVAFVERLKQESVYGLSAKKSGRWREVVGISLGLQRFGGLTSQTSKPKKRKLGNIISQNR